MGKAQTPHDELTYKIIGLAMEVHRELGPGFPEEAYQKAMAIALAGDAVPHEREVPITIRFRGQEVAKFKLDFVADRKVVLEFKAVSSPASVHEQQLIAYLAASGLELGLLINFGAASLEYKRVFPPRAIQSDSAFKERRAARQSKSV